MRVTGMGPLKISSQVRACPGLSCPQSVLCCPPIHPPPHPGGLTASLPLCYFFCFSFSFLFALLPPNPQCSRQCPSRPALASGHPGSSVRPAWERRYPSSPQVPRWPGLWSQLLSIALGALGGWGLSPAAPSPDHACWYVFEGSGKHKQAPFHMQTTQVPVRVRPVPWSGGPNPRQTLEW